MSRTRCDSLRIVFLAATSWRSPVAGRTRRLAEAVARLGHEAAFVELPSVRTAAGRCAPPRSNAGSIPDVIRLWPAAGGKWLPDAPTTRLWRRYALSALGNGVLHGRSGAAGGTAVVATTPWWADVATRLPADVLCYDCNDHFSIHAPARRLEAYRRMHLRMLERCDLAVAVNAHLAEEMAAAVPPGRRAVLHNAVDDRWPDLPARPMPVRRGRRRIVGFVGTLDARWIDLDLLARIADALPHADLLLAGSAARRELGDLRRRPNVHWLGRRPYAEVPRWLATFDVGLIPFRHNAIAAGADPLKLYEYSALGCPVVSTVRPDGDAPAAVRVAEPEAFVEAVRASLDEDPASHAPALRAYARRHTWCCRARELAGALCAARAAGRRP